MTTQTYRELLEARRQLEQKIEAVRNHERQTAIEQIKAMMAEFDISPEELTQRKYKVKETRSPVAPKYRDPETGATWSGRGKPPRWLAGKDRANFGI